MTVDRDIELLAGALVDFAKIMLESHGEFHPFGGYLDMEKKVVQVGVDGTLLDSDSGEKRLEMLIDGLKDIDQRKQTHALGMVTNVELSTAGTSGMSDAIKVHLEHRSGYCIVVFLIYSLHADSMKILDRFTRLESPLVYGHNV